MNESKQSLMIECFLTFLMVIFVGVTWTKSCGINIKLIFIVFIIYCAAFRLPLKFMEIKLLQATGRDNNIVTMFQVLSEIMQTAWMIYIFVQFYGQDHKCTEEPLLYWPTLILVIYGFYVLFKACLLTCVIVICVPVFCIMMRRANRPQWQGASNNLLNNLVRGRFDPRAYGNEESCPICLGEYTQDCEIVKQRNYINTESNKQ